jgi:hypothetical protein
MALKRKWIALAIIVFIYLFSESGMAGIARLGGIPFSIVSYSTFLAVGLAGFYGLKNEKRRWGSFILIFTYAFFLIIQLLQSFIHFLSGFENQFLLQISYRAFFISPVPYCILLFISHQWKNVKTVETINDVSQPS